MAGHPASYGRLKNQKKPFHPLQREKRRRGYLRGRTEKPKKVVVNSRSREGGVTYSWPGGER